MDYTSYILPAVALATLAGGIYYVMTDPATIRAQKVANYVYPGYGCGLLGYDSVPDEDGNVIRIYTQDECDILGGKFYGDSGQCLRPGGGSWSYDCRKAPQLTYDAL